MVLSSTPAFFFSEETFPFGDSGGGGARRWWVAATVGPFVFYLGLVVFCLSLDYRVFA